MLSSARGIFLSFLPNLREKRPIHLAGRLAGGVPEIVAYQLGVSSSSCLLVLVLSYATDTARGS